MSDPSASPGPAGPVYLIDASIFVYHAHQVVPSELLDTHGHPVNALQGFSRFLSDLIEQEQPRYMAVAFDVSSASSFRRRLYPAYKAHRPPAPETLKRQFLRCREVCAALGVPVYSHADYEADDVIGTLAMRMHTLGKAVVVVTRDKDLSQLIRPGDIYWDYIDGKRFGHAEVAARFGVPPARMAFFLALAGDAGDNIRGVPGIGTSTAKHLCAHFDSPAALYADLGQLSKLGIRHPKFVLEQLENYREAVWLAWQLTRIDCNVPMDAGLRDLERRIPNLEALNALYDAAAFGNALRHQAERISTLLMGSGSAGISQAGGVADRGAL